MSNVQGYDTTYVSHRVHCESYVDSVNPTCMADVMSMLDTFYFKRRVLLYMDELRLTAGRLVSYCTLPPSQYRDRGCIYRCLEYGLLWKICFNVLNEFVLTLLSRQCKHIVVALLEYINK